MPKTSTIVKTVTKTESPNKERDEPHHFVRLVAPVPIEYVFILSERLFARTIECPKSGSTSTISKILMVYSTVYFLSTCKCSLK